VVVIDMWKPYYDMAQAYFKNAIIVIDRFHYIRQVAWFLTRLEGKNNRDFLQTEESILNGAKSFLWLDFAA
jgi:transposase